RSYIQRAGAGAARRRGQSAEAAAKSVFFRPKTFRARVEPTAMPPQAAPLPGDPGSWPFVIVLISVALVVLLIAVVRMHAFLALIIAAATVGFLTPAGTLPGEAGKNHFVWAIERVTVELGNTAGAIAVVIGLAAIIGMCLMESGAADKGGRRFWGV